MATIKGTWKFNKILIFSINSIEEEVFYFCPIATPYDKKIRHYYGSKFYVDGWDNRIILLYEFTQPEIPSDFPEYYYPIPGTWYATYQAYNGGWLNEFGSGIDIFYFGDEPQEVSEEFYNFMIANAIEVTDIRYDEKLIAALRPGEYAILNCENKKAKTNIEVCFANDGEIIYKKAGEDIVETIGPQKLVTFQCKGKKMPSNINIKNNQISTTITIKNTSTEYDLKVFEGELIIQEYPQDSGEYVVRLSNQKKLGDVPVDSIGNFSACVGKHLAINYAGSGASHPVWNTNHIIGEAYGECSFNNYFTAFFIKGDAQIEGFVSDGGVK